jgi:hypothetical protein
LVRMEKDEGKRKKDAGAGWRATLTANSPTMGALHTPAARIVSEKRGGRKSKMGLGFEGQRAVEGFFVPPRMTLHHTSRCTASNSQRYTGWIEPNRALEMGQFRSPAIGYWALGPRACNKGGHGPTVGLSHN